MLETIRNFPRTCEETLKQKIKLPKEYHNANKIVISGMGGSAIAGDIIEDWLSDKLKIPIFVCRSYELPAFVDEKTLLICVSYSGNTKETLEQVKAGIKRKCKLVGISSNGELIKIFRRKKLPFAQIKGGILPRVAISYLLFSLISVLRALDFVKLDKITISCNPEEDAKVIARKIKGTFPVIYSIYPSVARRFKTQLNENSKVLARWEAIPEAAHNDIEGFVNLDEKFSLIFLRDEPAEREEIKKLIEFFKNSGKNATIIEIFAKGRTKLERILYLIWFTDFVSYFLAVENKVNPEETPSIKRFKKFVYGK
ncbi:MAG: bifunctional phosphoglucose/phosphomannose isomerase [Candidatus Aenigmarchaeota archaeon]|nr:bifunctional phosphoglucose/phosphomannose isomerase [Candidatus Aenigmarchaeota archaeon]